MTARQLDLLAGPRQRGRRPRVRVSEFKIHCGVSDILDRWLNPGWLWFHPANGELRDTPTGRRLKRMGVKPGVSDIILFGPGGHICALELKAPGGRPTVSQIASLEAVRAAGGQAAWVDSYQSAIAILSEWGALRRRVRVAA